MGRPPGYQWQPLGLDTDPVPGDPQALSAEAAHLTSVARTIDGQVTALHKIASDQTEKGQHADQIRSTALSLAGSLQAVAARYMKVSAAVSGWIPELEQAQALSLRALDQAEIPYAKLHQTVVLPSGSDLTAAQKQEVATYHASMQAAQDQLAAAKALLTRAVNQRDTQAAYTAAKINQASNDSLTDHESLWGWFSGEVAHFAYLIKDICTALEVVATILAVVALFIPGLDIVGALVLAGLVMTGVALLGRVVLALTGNGSWFDVAMDAVALASFGVGRLATTGLKLLAESSSTLGKTLVTADRADMLGRSEQFIAKAGDLFDNQAVGRIMAKQTANIEKLAPDVAKLTGKLPLVTRLALRVAGASQEDFTNFGKIMAVEERFSGNEAVEKLMASAVKTVGVLGANAGINLSTSIGVPAIGGLELDNSAGNPIHVGHVPLKINVPDNPVTRGYNYIENDTTVHGEMGDFEVVGYALTAGVL